MMRTSWKTRCNVMEKINWYKADITIVDMKVKRYLDES